MFSDSSWPSVPVEVLRRAFQLQPDGLANCPAGVTCKAWRTALTGSAAGSIYLYATTDNQEQRWQRLLSSRSSIESLKLVRAASWCWISSLGHYKLQRSAQTAQATLDSIPTACRALTLSEFCAHHLAQYTQKAPQLEELSFEWGALPFIGYNDMQTMPDLTPLCRLTRLQVKMQNDVDGDMLSQLIACCPDSLQSLKLHGFGSEDNSQPPVASLKTLNLLEHHLPALTKLELDECVVTIPGEDITCLSKLNSLGLSQSEVYVDGALDVERLTALTYLDLTDTTCYWEDAWIEVLDTFTPWPKLRILKTSGCNMFDNKTRVVVDALQEAHVSCPIDLDFTQDSQVQLQLQSVAPLMVIEPCEPATLGKHLDFRKLVTGLTLYPTGKRGVMEYTMDQVSTGFPNLRSLRFDGAFAVVTDAFDFALLPNLADLHLRAVGCPAFNLQCLSSLTSVNLSCGNDREHLCHLLLPTSLQALTFVGFGLFASSTQQNLLDLPCLSQVMLVTPTIQDSQKHWLLSQRPPMPKLPCCVTHLKLPTSVQLQSFIDWSNSKGCQSVQYLTLQTVPSPGDSLHDWVTSLPNLSVIDYVDGIEIEPYTGTRLPSVDDL